MDSFEYKPQLNKKEVQKLFKKYNLKQRDDLKENGDPFDFYELPDGKLLLVLGYGNGTGTLYRSETEYKEIMSAPDVRKPGEHMMSDLIASENTFLQQKDHYIQLLSKRTNVPLSKLDFTIQSIRLIDSSYKRQRPTMQVFFKEDYLYLIAYLGEVYKKKRGGDWYFEKEKGVVSLIPYIKLPDGSKMDLYYGLFKECYEDFEDMSIASVASVELLQHR